jgi:DHA3 family macrolide efflux protein-like MFS transporter
MWMGQAVSLFGSNLVQFALIWWLTQETGSATVLAMATLVGFLPQVLLGPFIGALVDRWNRRLIMISADSFIALSTLVLSFLFWTELVEIWHIYVIMFIRSLGSSFHWPAMSASTTLMVPEKQLSRVQGFNQMLQGGLSIVSAPLGALLLGIMPIQGILGIDIITALFAITALAFIHVPQPIAQKAAAIGGSSFWNDLKEGFRYVRAWPGLLMMMGMAMIINFLLNPAGSLMPLMVTNHFKGGVVQLGWLESSFGAGVVVGGILLGIWGGFQRRIVTSLVGIIGIGLGTLIAGLAPASIFNLAVGGLFLTGFMIPIANGPIHAVFQANIAPEMQGRVMGLIGSLTTMTTPLGLMIAGPVADFFDVRVWYIVAGVVTIIMGLVGFFIPALLHIEDRDKVAPSSPEAPEKALTLLT